MPRRLPIRVRVVAAFALAMALVLAGTGWFVYGRVARDLERNLDTDLRLRADDVSALVRDPHARLAGGRLVERGESFAELLSLDGRVLDATASLRGTPLLSGRELRRAATGPVFLDRPSVPGLDEIARLLATPVPRGVLVVGATRENRAEALRNLRTALLLGGPIALILATALGYMLAGAGLRAVEDMRRRAAAVSAEGPVARLPVPRTGDELERLGTTLNEMLSRLEAGLQRERGFVAEAGHELRTPLALLRAELDFAQRHAETEEELRTALRAAGEETDRLVQLAGSLLLVAGADEGRLELRREPVDARALLESVRNRFALRGRPIEVEAPAGLMLDGDRLRLEQALGNLVDNALRHGTGTVRLEAVQRRGADPLDCVLHVRDEGTGIPADFLPRAFQRFSRPDASRARPGAGLGLAIVDAIARAHGGRAGAHGADVWIEVPTAAAPGPLREPPCPPAARGSADGAGARRPSIP